MYKTQILWNIETCVNTDSDYINITKFSKYFKNKTGIRREPYHYFVGKRNRDVLKHFSERTGIPVDDLWKVEMKSCPKYRGTYVHPYVCIQFLIWLNNDLRWLINSEKTKSEIDKIILKWEQFFHTIKTQYQTQNILTDNLPSIRHAQKIINELKNEQSINK